MNKPSVYEVYRFYVISVKRLYNTFADEGITLNKGWIVIKYYDESIIWGKLKRITEKCSKEKSVVFYTNIGTYLIRQNIE